MNSKIHATAATAISICDDAGIAGRCTVEAIAPCLLKGNVLLSECSIEINQPGIAEECSAVATSHGQHIGFKPFHHQVTIEGC